MQKQEQLMTNSLNKSPSSQEIASRSQDLCYSCESALWISLYFDGFGYSLPEAGGIGDVVSNIGKLFRSRDRNNDKLDRSAFYYPGLGARFEPELSIIAKTGLSKVWNDSVDAATPKPVESSKDQLSDYAKERGKDVLKTRSTDTAISKVTGDIKNNVRHGRQILARGFERNIDHIDGLARRQLSGLMSHWRPLWHAVTRHPWRTFKLHKEAGAAAFRYTVGRVVEATPLRDTKFCAALFNMGVDTRLKAAKDDFKKAVHQAQKLYTVKHINVALFGYDNGGAIAVGFANQLMNELCDEGKFGGIEVKLKFIGLFDCVSYRYADNFVTAYIPLSNGVVNNLEMPKQVEKVVHLCAAHEYRFYKPLSIIDGKAELGAKYEEWMYPGAQADVGGGYEDGEEGKSNQLARVPLNFMHGQACRHAVPLLSMERLKAEQGKVHLDFLVDPALDKLVCAYRRHAAELSKQVVPFTTQELLAPFTLSDSRCLRAPSITQPMMRLPETVKDGLKGHHALFVLWLRSVYDAHIDDQDPEFAEFRKEMLAIARVAAMGAIDGQLKELYAQWKSAEGHPLPDELQPLFSQYVHNSVLVADEGFAARLSKQVDMFFCSPSMLHYRSVLEMSKQPEKTWLEERAEYAQAYAKTINEIGPSGYPQAGPPKAPEISTQPGKTWLEERAEQAQAYAKTLNELGPSGYPRAAPPKMP
jgi:hypothetical protein